LLTNRATLNNNINNIKKQISAIIYVGKFECSITSKDLGVLAPGYYDTDISIFNKQRYSVTMLLSVVVSNGNSSANSIIKTLQPLKSTGISCKGILNTFNIKERGEPIEGFITILIQLDNALLGSLSNNEIQGNIPTLQSPPSPGQINLLDVHLFYSTNSFAAFSLQNQVVLHKITFSILNYTSAKIPHSVLWKTLYITIPSQTNATFDPETQIKRTLSARYNLSNTELTNMKLKIYNIESTTTTMLDRHAISSSSIQPQAIY
jgi:hypothetical protein